MKNHPFGRDSLHLDKVPSRNLGGCDGIRDASTWKVLTSVSPGCILDFSVGVADRLLFAVCPSKCRGGGLDGRFPPGCKLADLRVTFREGRSDYAIR